MATINLAPSNEYQVATQRRQRVLFIAALVLIVLLILVWAILFGLTVQADNNNDENGKRLAALETEIAEQSEDNQRIILFERRLNAMDGLLKQHVTWDPLLREVERLLPPSTTLDKASMKVTDGTITVNGVTPDLDQLSQTIASLTTKGGHSTLFKKVELTHTERREQKVDNVVVGAAYSFGLDIIFDAAQLKKAY